MPAANAPGPLRQALALLGWLLLCFAAAGVGGVASVQAGSFYTSLERPPWAPPPWLFGPVWTVLYTLMAVAAWTVWRRRAGAAGRRALVLFGVQLAANALWTWLFFAWRLGAWAFAEVLLLAALVALTIAAFAPVSRLAAALLLPYVAWVGFASALTFSLWRRNPGVLG
jgi:translocator protein